MAAFALYKPHYALISDSAGECQIAPTDAELPLAAASLSMQPVVTIP
jgi:hypothetical protein